MLAIIIHLVCTCSGEMKSYPVYFKKLVCVQVLISARADIINRQVQSDQLMYPVLCLKSVLKVPDYYSCACETFYLLYSCSVNNLLSH